MESPALSSQASLPETESFQSAGPAEPVLPPLCSRPILCPGAHILPSWHRRGPMTRQYEPNRGSAGRVRSIVLRHKFHDLVFPDLKRLSSHSPTALLLDGLQAVKIRFPNIAVLACCQVPIVEL